MYSANRSSFCYFDLTSCSSVCLVKVSAMMAMSMFRMVICDKNVVNTNNIVTTISPVLSVSSRFIPSKSPSTM